MEPIHLTVDGDDVVILQGLLLKARATELAELRRLPDPAVRLRRPSGEHGERAGRDRGPDRRPDPIARPDAGRRRAMTGMQAAVRDRYGSPDVVELREVERPTPVDDEVLVRVRAASVNRADLDGITPRPSFVRLFIGLRAPRNHRLGLDVAGVVEARRSGRDPVPARRRGLRRPVRRSGQGAFAEYVCAPGAGIRSRCPTGMSFEEAATLPHSAILAVQGLRRRDGTHDPARRQGPDRRRIGQRRSVRGPDREVDGRGRHRRLQPGEDGLRALARRRPRARLRGGRLHDDRRALRLDPRHGFAPPDPRHPPRAATEGRLRHARRDGACRSSRRWRWDR